MFAREGLSVELLSTTGSVAQLTGLAAGEFDIAITAFDNVVAYVEGQGEAPISAQPEFFAFMGSDDSFLALVARPEISQISELRGRSLSVDAATTGYAFVLFDMLERAGLEQGAYTIRKVGGMAQRFDDLCRGGSAATLLSAPYDLLAERAGMCVLKRLEPPYQGNVAAARRSWAEGRPDLLVSFVRAYVAALRWLAISANRDAACDILMRHVPGMTPALARASHALMLRDNSGFSRDGRIGPDGVARVLRLRSRYAAGNRKLTEPRKYSEMRYWRLAMAGGG
jgi:ABC-type nitrate/sulfonate/bicarbonate transport system substrate-binding protein